MTRSRGRWLTGSSAARGRGERVAELPSGTVTFLFTDLEGSTRRWEEHPEAMPAALVRHDEILHNVIEGHGGVVLSEMGDGMAAVFASAAGGVAAALDIQRALQDEPWGEVGPLRARMGLHAGDGVLRADGQYVNAPLNRCARLMAVAHGGQVVCSDSVAVLLRDGLDPEVSLEDLGEHRLRDLAEPVRVFQVTHAVLAPKFPPLRSMDAFPGNLPVQLTSFVGRDSEMNGIAKALDEWRMVTLTGVGGVGKTRLSLQVAAEVLPRFRDGAWLCELAVADDDETMGQVVTAALGVSQRPGMSLTESVSDYLRPKELLLVLDNCEQILGPAYDLADRVLRECPGVRILATSREGLGVDGERVWPGRSLPLPDATGTNIATSDAVMLFAERAEAAKATFALDGSNAAAVVEVCRRLDGIPLAIELAAARVASMTPSEISGLLGERFRLLTGGRRKGVERHQTLRATVDWSYSLLTETERIVFDRLGVFAGSFDAPGAQAVVTGDGIEAWDVLDALSELVAKSMLVAEDTADNTTRYQMLETLAQYARERLDETGTTDDWRRRHADHYAAWAETAGPALEGPDELAWRARETVELDNLRDAVTWALDCDDPDDITLALRIIAAFSYETNINASFGIGAWAGRAVPHAETSTPQMRYAVTAAAAMHQQNLGNYEHAIALAEQAIDHGVPPGSLAPSTALGIIQTCAEALGDSQRSAEAALEVATLVDREYPESVHAVSAHVARCRAALGARDPIARQEAETALSIARRTANPTALALALGTYGWAQIADDPTAALATLDESIALGRQGAHPVSAGMTLCLAAGVRARTGEFNHATRDLREAVERAHQQSARLTLYTALLWGIYLLVALDHLDQAAVFDGMASTGLSPEYRAQPAWARVRDAITNARAALGPDRYDAAFQTGAQMTHDQIVQHTLRTLDDLIAETDQSAAV